MWIIAESRPENCFCPTPQSIHSWTAAVWSCSPLADFLQTPLLSYTAWLCAKNSSAESVCLPRIGGTLQCWGSRNEKCSCLYTLFLSPIYNMSKVSTDIRTHSLNLVIYSWAREYLYVFKPCTAIGTTHSWWVSWFPLSVLEPFACCVVPVNIMCCFFSFFSYSKDCLVARVCFTCPSD